MIDTKRLRQKILDLAIRGKLVPQDPTDEPASILLERIHQEKLQMVADGKLKKKDVAGDSIIYRGEDNLHYEKVGNEEPVCIEDELPFELPEGWCWARIGAAISIARGGSPRPIKEFITTRSDGINWIKIGDCEKGGRYITSVSEKIKPEGLRKTRMVHCGDFLLTNSMSFGRPYILKVDGCIHDGWLVFERPDKAFDVDFLYHMLSSAFAYEQFSLAATGSTVKNLNIDKVKQTVFPIPPLAEQQRIAETLDSHLALVDDIEHNQTGLDELLTKTRSKVLDLAIRGKLVAQDPTDEPASVLLERIHQEKLQMVADGKLKKKDVAGDSVIYRGEDNSYYEKIGSDAPIAIDETLHIIPLGWIWTRLQSVVSSLQSGCDLKPQQYNDEGSGIPYMTGASNIVDGELIFNRWTNEPKTIAHKGDLLVSCKGTVGLTALVRFSDVHIARQFMALQTNTFSTSECREYLRIIIDTQSNRLVAGSTGLIPGIDRKTILTQTIPLPPINEQVRIADYIKTSAALLQEIKKG